jgi:hypothetical protein
MDTKKMRDTFKFFDSIAALVTYCGGPKHVAKGSWQRSNPTTWASIISSLFSYILMMAVSVACSLLLRPLVFCWPLLGCG